MLQVVDKIEVEMNDSITPLVSVLMTAYNREKYIGEAIESVLASNFRDFELIIVDDCSSDNTVAIAKDFEKLDKRIKVYVNEKNLSQFVNRNRAAALSTGKYIKYLDSDDIMYPNCLTISFEAMEAYPDAAVGAEHKSFAAKLPICYLPHESYVNHYFKNNPLLFTGPTDCIFRRDIFMSFGGFDESIGILSDTLLMLKLANVYKVVGYETNLTYYRMHDNQVTIGQLNWAAMLIERNQINWLVLNDSNCPLNETENKILKRNLKNILVRNLFYRTSKNNFSEARIVYKKTGLKLLDCFLAILPNKKIKERNFVN